MKLSEVFSQLAYGELSQMGVINDTGDGLLPSKYGQMVAHVNMGLTALYKRFLLKEAKVSVTLVPGKSTYPLVSTTDTLFVVSQDSPVFLDNIHKIERVYTDTGIELALNDDYEAYSCKTPSMNTLQVPYDIVNKVVGLPAELLTDSVQVVYRANHPKLVYVSTVEAPYDPSTVTLELPDSHLEPLLLYVASRVNNPVGMTNEFHAGNSYYAKYEKACQELETTNIRIDQGRQNSKLVSNGWV